MVRALSSLKNCFDELIELTIYQLIESFIGNLIDTSGSMSGGGKPVRTGGGMGPSRPKDDGVEVTAATVKSLEEALGRLQQQLQQCRTSLADAEKKLKDSKQRLKSSEIEVVDLHIFCLFFRFYI